jgi:hypothetical protein
MKYIKRYGLENIILVIGMALAAIRLFNPILYRTRTYSGRAEFDVTFHHAVAIIIITLLLFYIIKVVMNNNKKE